MHVNPFSVTIIELEYLEASRENFEEKTCISNQAPNTKPFHTCKYKQCDTKITTEQATEITFCVIVGKGKIKCRWVSSSD